MSPYETAALIIACVVAGGGIVFGYIKARSDLLSGSKQLIGIKDELIDALEEKNAALDAEVQALELRVGLLEKSLQQVIASVASSSVCAKARSCPNYQPPTVITS